MIKKDNIYQLVDYLGKKVSPEYFRVYVYAKDGSKKVVNTYKEYQEAIATNEWFPTKEDAKPRPRKRERLKDDADR